jgi:nucleotide-binding universal stress UspA family protein
MPQLIGGQPASARPNPDHFLLWSPGKMIFEHLLVATDFSESARGALDLAVEMSRKFEADLTLVHCWEAPSYSYGGGLYVPVDLVTPIERSAHRCLEEALTELKKRAPTAKSVLRSGSAWQEILVVAREIHADLIVVGTHGRRGLDRVLLGSVAEKVVRMAHVPVLTVHGPGVAK